MRDFQSAACATYLPRAPETISLSIPAEAVQSAVAYPPTPALGGFIVSVDAGAAKLSLRLGAHTTPVGATDERFFRSAEGHTLSIELTGGDTWRPGVGLGGATLDIDEEFNLIITPKDGRTPSGYN